MRNECLFSGFMGNDSECEQTNHVNHNAALWRFVCSTPLIHSRWARKKRHFFLPLWTELSRKYLGTDKCIFRGVVQDSIYDVTPWLLAWRCHRQWRHYVVLRTTKTTSKSDYLLKMKAWEKNNQSLHSGRDKGIPSLCPWFATSTTRQPSSWIANHGHSDGIPLSLPECSDRFFYSYI